MTPELERRRRKLESRLQQWEKDALALAVDAGASEPYVWVEAENGVYIRDKAHSCDDDGRVTFGAGRESVVLMFRVPLNTGAW